MFCKIDWMMESIQAIHSNKKDQEEAGPNNKEDKEVCSLVTHNIDINNKTNEKGLLDKSDDLIIL